MILSIIGVDHVPQLVYYRAKALQEKLLCQGPTPYSIVRHTPSRGLRAERAVKRTARQLRKRL